jgi:aminoglycoside phosphotransferase (APT) family kinase protein
VATLVLKTYAPTNHGQEHAAREWQALTRLRAADYPAPRAILFEPDDRHIGSPFIVMEHIAGQQLWEAHEHADQSRQERLTRLFVTRLVELHALNPQIIEPALTWAHPYVFIERELEALRRDSERSPHQTLAQVVSWLEQRKAAVPCERPVILHRDYHPWNVLVDATDRLNVIDWDWKIGDARFDLAWTLTLMRRSNFDAFSTAVQDEYVRLSDHALEELAYFEVLTTMRWLLNVTQSVASSEALYGAAREAFREFLVEPVQHAVMLLREHTGVAVQVTI